MYFSIDIQFYQHKYDILYVLKITVLIFSIVIVVIDRD